MDGRAFSSSPAVRSRRSPWHSRIISASSLPIGPVTARLASVLDHRDHCRRQHPRNARELVGGELDHGQRRCGGAPGAQHRADRDRTGRVCTRRVPARRGGRPAVAACRHWPGDDRRFWAYEGWQYVTFSAGETRDPQRVFPRAIAVATVALVVLYMVANLGYVAALGVNGAAAKSDHVAADAMRVAFGPLSGKLFRCSCWCRSSARQTA